VGYFLLRRGELRRAEILLQSSVGEAEKFDERIAQHTRWILASVRVGLANTPSRETPNRPSPAGACLRRRRHGDTRARWRRSPASGRRISTPPRPPGPLLSDLLSIDARFGPAQVGAVRAELRWRAGDAAGALALAGEAFALLHEQRAVPTLPRAPF
jgi:hypothetical protein